LFDNSVNKLTSFVVDCRDDTAPPNGVLPAMTDSCDLMITLDNKAPVLEERSHKQLPWRTARYARDLD